MILHGQTADPVIVPLKKGINLFNTLMRRMETIDADSPLLLSWQVGAGKTYAVVHGILPWAMQVKKKILYVSSRTAKVCIVTAVVDAGVSFKDDLLSNVVIFSLLPDTIIQVLGRKRRSRGSKEKVNMYVYCPSLKMLNRRLSENQDKQSILDSYPASKAHFIRNFILEPEKYDFRPLIYVYQNGSMIPNSMGIHYLEYEASIIEEILWCKASNAAPEPSRHGGPAKGGSVRSQHIIPGASCKAAGCL